jgi:LPXTG-motif cell wall-anchored protein
MHDSRGLHVTASRLTIILFALCLLVPSPAFGAEDVCSDNPDASWCSGPSEQEPTCPTDGTPCDDLPERDCASGPDPDSQEYEDATEWREWYEANCETDVPVEVDTPVVIERPDECERSARGYCPEHEATDNVIEDEPAATAPAPRTAATASTLPVTGSSTPLLALLGALLLAAGATMVRAPRTTK